MSVYLKQFSTHSEYEAYIASEDKVLPNVSICKDTEDVHYNPYVPPTPVETRVVAKFNVTSTSSPTPIGYNQYTTGFSEIEIDGVVQPSVVSAYTFSTTGEHTVKYTLTDPTIIGLYSFLGCASLTSIDIPSGVTSIGVSAFKGCTSLTSIEIPSGVTSIRDSAFSGCSSMSSCTFAEGSVLTSIGESAFTYCTSLTSIDIPDSVIGIIDYAFRYCSGLISCTIGSGVTSIRDNAFRACSSLNSITSNAVTAPTIQNYTFYGIKTGGTLTVPSGSSGYDTWMQNADYYLGLYDWTKVEQ